MTMSKQWIDNQGVEFDRNEGLGASEVAAVLGYDSYTTPYKIWAIKTGRIDPDEENAAMLAGKRHQPTVLAYYNDAPERNSAYMYDVPITYREANPRLWATPDAVDFSLFRPRLVELKTTEVWNKDDWAEDAPIRHRVQCQIQRLAYERINPATDNTVMLAVLIGLSNYREYEVPYNQEWAVDSIQYVIDWWQRHVVADVPPDVTPADIETFRRLHPDDTGEVIEADEELAEWIADLDRIRGELSTLNKDEKALKAKIEARVKDATYVRTGTGALKLTWQERKGYEVKPSRTRVFRRLNEKQAEKELGA